PGVEFRHLAELQCIAFAATAGEVVNDTAAHALYAAAALRLLELEIVDRPVRREPDLIGAWLRLHDQHARAEREQSGHQSYERRGHVVGLLVNVEAWNTRKTVSYGKIEAARRARNSLHRTARSVTFASF